MDQSIISKLLNYQVPHCLSLKYAFENSNIIIDASDTGTGKTYCSLAICKQFGLKPIIICPKSVIQNWKDVCEYFEIQPEIVINYEKVLNGSFFNNNQESYPFVVFNSEKKTFEWLLQPNHIVIMDEVHRCKNSRTHHAQLLLGLKGTENKVILLSATLADKIKLFKNFGYVMGFYEDPNKFTSWLKKLIKSQNQNSLKPVPVPVPVPAPAPSIFTRFGSFFGFGSSYSSSLTNTSNNTPSKLKIKPDKPDESIALNKKLFPDYGGRMRIKDLGDMFPKNDVKANCYKMNNADKIAEQYKIIEDAYADIKEKAENASVLLAQIIRARQAIEILKIPTFIELIKENIVNGKSSVVFVNFNETLRTIANDLNIDCVVHGDQTIEERNQNIKDFQANKKTSIILNIRAGGTGISLHDVLGSHQRVSIISPTWSAQDFIQCLGRIHRAGAKTDAIQKIVFCEGTIEEFICGTLKYKLEHLSKLNDGDLDTYKIEGINTTETKNASDSDSESDTESDLKPALKSENLLGDDKLSSSTSTKLFNPMSHSKKNIKNKSSKSVSI